MLSSLVRLLLTILPLLGGEWADLPSLRVNRFVEVEHASFAFAFYLASFCHEG